MLFWTDMEDVLWCQYGDETGTRVQLATNVLYISACRGWNSKTFTDQDMGLIIAYVKYDGIIAYRTKTGKAVNNPIWENEELLDEAEDGNSKVHVHRLNDYRIGFSVTGCNKHFITKRTTIGAGAAPQSVFVKSFGKKLWSIHFSHDSEVGRSLQVIDSDRLSATHTIIEFSHPIWFQDLSISSNLKAEKPNAQEVVIVDFYVEDENVLHIITEPLSVYSNMTIKIPGTSSMTFGMWTELSSSTNFAPVMTIVVEGDGVDQDEASFVKASLLDFSISYEGLQYRTHEQSEQSNVVASLVAFEINHGQIQFVTYEDENHGEASLVATFVLFTIHHEYVGSEPL
jgi:hypothetical protein